MENLSFKCYSDVIDLYVAFYQSCIHMLIYSNIEYVNIVIV
ncbi:unnamed protein product [Schistosoma mattheei]|uniref:Uncharacterized protein n=1 Tax=Schistosoma mattheei TaxID=31246 RepID=A0A3P8J2Y8_9TREM|nr:unnamed protein product [Schistosoma mattheei]